MKKNLSQIVDGSGRWVNIYQVWDAAGVVVAKVTAAEARDKFSGLQYQFSLLHQVAA